MQFLRDTLPRVVLVYGMITALSPLLQLRRVRATGSARDVSLAGLVIFWGAFILWGAYGLLLTDPVIIAVNAVAFVTMSATIATVLVYRSRERPAVVDGG